MQILGKVLSPDLELLYHDYVIRTIGYLQVDRGLNAGAVVCVQLHAEVLSPEGELHQHDPTGESLLEVVHGSVRLVFIIAASSFVFHLARELRGGSITARVEKTTLIRSI